MDRDGVYAHVIYGPVFSINADDPQLRDACYSAYNDSLMEFCAAAPDRLLGVPMLPPAPDAAADELLRLARSGAWGQANLQIAEVEPRLHDPAWERLWDALEETGMILSFHVAVTGVPRDDPSFGKPASAFAAAKAFIGQFLDPFVDLFAWGILERHPKLRVMMAESGLGWVPWVVQELDHRFELMNETRDYWDRHGGVALTVRPSELFKRQIYASFQDDRHGAAAVYG
jgi:predicted TIM-barrel fold metal-dependent hydrolase